MSVVVAVGRRNGVAVAHPVRGTGLVVLSVVVVVASTVVVGLVVSVSVLVRRSVGVTRAETSHAVTRFQLCQY